MAYISAAESFRISSTTFTQSAQKATEFGEITQPLGLLRRSRSFKVIEFGTNRKPICHFLLVINSNVEMRRVSASLLSRGTSSEYFASTSAPRWRASIVEMRGVDYFSAIAGTIRFDYSV